MSYVGRTSSGQSSRSCALLVLCLIHAGLGLLTICGQRRSSSRLFLFGGRHGIVLLIRNIALGCSRELTILISCIQSSLPHLLGSGDALCSRKRRRILSSRLFGGGRLGLQPGLVLSSLFALLLHAGGLRLLSLKRGNSGRVLDIPGS